MDFKDLSPEDQQAIVERVTRARAETPALLKEGRYADAFDLVYFAALIDPESMQLAMRIAHQVEGIHLLRPDQIELLRQHAEEKRPLAQYLYGFWLWFNRKRTADIDEVVELLEAASKWGIGDASYVLSRIYDFGEAGSVDKELSNHYYELAGTQELNFKWFRERIRDHIYGRRGEREEPENTITILRNIIGLPNMHYMETYSSATTLSDWPGQERSTHRWARSRATTPAGSTSSGAAAPTTRTWKASSCPRSGMNTCV